MKPRNVFFVTALLVVAILMTTGCYWKRAVETSQVAIRSHDGVTTDEIVGAGRYDDMSYRAEIHVLDASAKTVTWTDPDLLTGDSQPIGIDISVSYRRPKSDQKERVELLWDNYRTEAQNDEALAQLVLSRLPEAVKSVTPQKTLQGMTGITEGGTPAELAAAAVARQETSQDMEAALQRELDDTGIIVLNLAINNIAPDPGYVDTLKAKARADAELELSRARTAQLKEQEQQEKAQTNIDLEKARRDNLVAEERAKVFEQSDRAYELERLKLLQGVIGASDKIYFVPPNSDLTLILGGQSAIPIK